MLQNTSLLKIVWRKYKRWIIALNLGVLVMMGPLYFVSGWIGQTYVLNDEYAPKNKIESLENLQVEIFTNFEEDQRTLFRSIVIDEINRAKKEIFVGMYSFTINEIKDALLDAQRRGVEVKVYLYQDNSVYYEEMFVDDTEFLNVEYIGDNVDSDYYSFHNKFMIVDPGLEGSVLLTGSWNWSYLQEELDPNILLRVKNGEIIDRYFTEIKRVESGRNGYHKFGDFSYGPWDSDIMFADGSKVEVWFSPGRGKNSIETRIVDLAKEAEKSIDIGMTVVDSKRIANALLAKAEGGVMVRLIVDRMSVDAEDSLYRYIEDRIKDGALQNFSLIVGGKESVNELGQYSIFHHHNMIVDGEIVLTGTANWTYGGFYLNDENILIIHNRNIADKYIRIMDEYVEMMGI